MKVLCEGADQRRIGGPVDVFGGIECWMALHAANIAARDVLGPSHKRKRGRQRLSMA